MTATASPHIVGHSRTISPGRKARVITGTVALAKPLPGNGLAVLDDVMAAIRCPGDAEFEEATGGFRVSENGSEIEYEMVAARLAR